MTADRFWLGVLITLAVIFFYCVSLTGDDVEGSVGPPPSPTSSESRRCDRPHGHRRDCDRASERLHTELIEEKGLCRGEPWGADGSVCTVEAICQAAARCGSFGLFRAAESEMELLIGPITRVATLSAVATWSDTKALDAFDAANHLRKAAERWAERAWTTIT